MSGSAALRKAKVEVGNQPQAPKINSRYLQFISRYLVHGDSTKAAEEAGFSKKFAGPIGRQLLSRDDVAGEIGRLRIAAAIERANAVDISLAMVIEELQAIAFSDIRRILRHTKDDKAKGGYRVELVPFHELDDMQARAISKLRIKGDGEVYVELWPKPEALLTLGRHLGLRGNAIQAGRVGHNIMNVGSPDASLPLAPIDLTRLSMSRLREFEAWCDEVHAETVPPQEMPDDQPGQVIEHQEAQDVVEGEETHKT